MNDNGNVIKFERSYTEDDIVNAMQEAAGYVVMTVSIDGMVSAFTTLERLCDVQRVIDAGEESLVGILE